MKISSFFQKIKKYTHLFPKYLKWTNGLNFLNENVKYLGLQRREDDFIFSIDCIDGQFSHIIQYTGTEISNC